MHFFSLFCTFSYFFEKVCVQKNVCRSAQTFCTHVETCKHCGHLFVAYIRSKKNDVLFFMNFMLRHRYVFCTKNTQIHASSTVYHTGQSTHPPCQKVQGSLEAPDRGSAPRDVCCRVQRAHWEPDVGLAGTPCLPCCIGFFSFNPLKEKGLFFRFFRLFLQEKLFFL